MILFLRALAHLCCMLLPVTAFLNCAYISYFYEKITGRTERTFKEAMGKRMSQRWVIITLEIVFVLGVIFLILFCSIKSDDIGSFFEDGEYDAQYYVDLRKENSKTSYRLKADISRVGIIYNGFAKGLFLGLTGQNKAYMVSRVYWNNGGYIDFKLDNDSIVKPGKEMECVDRKLDTYYITLSKTKVTKK